MKKLSTQQLTMLGALVALEVVLARILGLEIGGIIRISFKFIPVTIRSALFHPILSGFGGAVADVIGYVLKPTGAFFPGFTLTAFLGSVIYGIFYYKKPITPLRIAMATASVTLICDVLLNTLWLVMLTGNPFTALMTSRLPVQLTSMVISIVVQAVVLGRVVGQIERNIGI
ncbi:MAG: folate family ECF transporter S component [Tissierellia bacterium]|nr:folate family ECF transporter S component [Tissierellia bacterium]